MDILPTTEQKIIIDAVAKGKTVKIAALAGTGKTSTLVMIANTYPNRKGLYLAYNKSLQLDAQKKFPPWIECKTVHSLAYQTFGARYRNQLTIRVSPEELVNMLGIKEFHTQLQINGKNISLTQSKILLWTRSIVRHFTFSNRKEIDLAEVQAFLQKEIRSEYSELEAIERKVFDRLGSKVFEYAKDLWSSQKNSLKHDIPAEHDTYLKLYQLSRPIMNSYDYIMLDEAQDANPCILDILSNQVCQIIYVGDEHQQIYAFRGTVNAMKSIKASTHFLTQSFRFGKAIADEANVMLSHLKSDLVIKGCPKIRSYLRPTPLPYTYISRTNAKLIEECVEKIENGYKCCFAGDMREIINLIRSVFFLRKNKSVWVTDQRIKKFLNWDQFVKAARDQEEQELLMPINFVIKHGGSTLNKLKLVEREARHREHEADIIFTTAHKAKGREWNNVRIGDDFTLKNDHEKNLYYVALTRAKISLQHTTPSVKDKT